MKPPQVEVGAVLPTKDELEVERGQLTLELGNALFRHRAAWRRVVEVNKAYGGDWASQVRRDGDQRYINAMADVKFWREEAQIAGTALMALDHAAQAPMIPRSRGANPPVVHVHHH